MQFNTYTAAAGLIAADLVNSADSHGAALSTMLARYEVHDCAVSAAAARRLRSWASRLRPVFGAEAYAQADLVDHLLVVTRCRLRLLRHHGLAPHLHYSPLDADIATRVKALTAAGLAYLIADGYGSRLGCCRRDGCSVVFIDTSRNGRRHFCSLRCANVVNVANHRSRRRAGYQPNHAGT